MLGSVAQDLRPPCRKWMPVPDGQDLERARQPPAVVLKEFVLDRDYHFVSAGVALAAAAPDYLAIYPGRLVELGQDNMEAAAFGNTGRQFDVGASAGHIGRDSDPPRCAGFGHNRRLRTVVVSVEDDVIVAGLGEHRTKPFRIRHRTGGDKHRTSL